LTKNDQKTDVTRKTLAALFIGLLIAASLWTIWRFIPATVWAVMIVIATWPILRRVQAWLGDSMPRLASWSWHCSC
jgi:predicted PurR-regulated permease PerM